MHTALGTACMMNKEIRPIALNSGSAEHVKNLLKNADCRVGYLCFEKGVVCSHVYLIIPLFSFALWESIGGFKILKMASLLCEVSEISFLEMNSYCNKYTYLIAMCFFKESVKQFKKSHEEQRGDMANGCAVAALH